jgi:hypothetical protein
VGHQLPANCGWPSSTLAWLLASEVLPQLRHWRTSFCPLFGCATLAHTACAAELPAMITCYTLAIQASKRCRF